MRRQNRLDFAQFDAHSAQFDLAIDSAQVLDVAIGPEAT